MTLNWVYKKFEELSATELYTIIHLRNEVFVVEQNGVYQDADGKDLRSYHLAGWDGNDLVAYTRIMPRGLSYEQAGNGRVVTSTKYRRAGAVRELMKESIHQAFSQMNCTEIKIGAQV